MGTEATTHHGSCPWGVAGGGGDGGNKNYSHSNLFYFIFYSFYSVDICSKLTFMKERLTPKPKPPFFSVTSLIQVFCKLSKLRACGYHQVV